MANAIQKKEFPEVSDILIACHIMNHPFASVSRLYMLSCYLVGVWVVRFQHYLYFGHSLLWVKKKLVQVTICKQTDLALFAFEIPCNGI